MKTELYPNPNDWGFCNEQNEIKTRTDIQGQGSPEGVQGEEGLTGAGRSLPGPSRTETELEQRVWHLKRLILSSWLVVLEQGWKICFPTYPKHFLQLTANPF